MDFSSYLRLVGQNVRRARLAASKTQQDIAGTVLTLKGLSELERGLGNPTLYTLFRLAKKLNVSATELINVGEPAGFKTPLRELEVKPIKAGRKPRPKRGRAR